MSSTAIADIASHESGETKGFGHIATDGRRLAGLAFGVGTQALFLVTVVGLWSFLRYGVAGERSGWLLTDILLALQFVVPHSILLHPRTRRAMKAWVSAEFHGAVFCVGTCLSLLLIFRCWRGSGDVLWEFSGTAATAIVWAFGLSWAALLYSISLTGLGYQTGWTQWLYWYRQQRMPRRDFYARGAYRLLRHPVYLSFLGLIWFTPVMTTDHAVLTGLWSVYIAVGSVLKDRRLLHYLGADYADYMTRVPGYPLIPFGPLSRQRSPVGTSRCSN
ncbi:MAG: hypothetical protein R3C19_02680 [Planctomycetaceae bacterium]